MSDKAKKITDTEVRQVKKELQDIHAAMSISDSEEANAESAFSNMLTWFTRSRAWKRKARARIVELEKKLKGE